MKFKNLSNKGIQIDLTLGERNMMKEILKDSRVPFSDVKKIEFLQKLDWKI